MIPFYTFLSRKNHTRNTRTAVHRTFFISNIPFFNYNSLSACHCQTEQKLSKAQQESLLGNLWLSDCKGANYVQVCVVRFDVSHLPH
jgi:hypothetical protein